MASRGATNNFIERFGLSMVVTKFFRKKLVIWGAGGHAKVLHEFIKELGYELIALFDNDTNAVSPLSGVPLYYGTIGFMDWRKRQRHSHKIRCLVAIGGWRGRDRLQIQRYLQSQGLMPSTVTHPAAYVAKTARTGVGSQILAGCVIGVDVQIGDACIINTSASIDHECQLGDGVHIAPGATIAGCVGIGSFSFVGTGAAILPRVRIGTDCIIGAGSIVTRDIPDGVVAYGCPARVIRKNSEQHNG